MNWFLALCAVCALGLGSVYWRSAGKVAISSGGTIQSPVQQIAVRRPDSGTPATPEAEAPKPTAVPAIDSKPKPRPIYFRWTATDEHYGQLAFVNHPAPAPEFVPHLACEVVHFAGATGVCLKADRGVFTRYSAVVFDSQFKQRHSVPLNGIPSRTRVAPDGRTAAVTVFLTGHSYASVDFTTQTLLIDTASGKVLADLETFAANKDGQPFQAADFNYWGVTFTPDGRRFYCTLSTNRRHYLVEGDIAARTVRVIHQDVECPSLSPDATLVAYKKRLPGDKAAWQLQVLVLSTGVETSLGEKRSVDDQLEWLDTDHVLYSLPESEANTSATTDVWIVAANGTGKPRMFLPKAYSPAVVR